MNRRNARLGTVLLAGVFFSTAARLSAVEPEEARIRDHVARLASPEFQGRRGSGGDKAAKYVADQLQRLGLKPLFDGSFFQTIPGREGVASSGRNVGAVLRGADPALRDQWVIVSAHFDHLGTREGVVYPGADDNASGVAMMLEVARSFVEGKEPPKRSLMFIGFDLEEVGLFGSRYFVEHSPAPLANVSLFITADMIGRSLGGVCEPYVFVMGTEHAPGVRSWIDGAAKGKTVTVGLLGSDLLLLDRSDYGPFRTRKVPYLFFSTGESPVYHTPLDVPETLNYAKVEAISRIILGVTRRAVEIDHVPAWSSAPDHTLAEAVTIRAVLRILLANRAGLKIGAAPLLLIKNAIRSLDAIIARGVITAEERTGVVRVARIVLMSVL